jgi:hypothetical protein
MAFWFFLGRWSQRIISHDIEYRVLRRRNADLERNENEDMFLTPLPVYIAQSAYAVPPEYVYGIAPPVYVAPSNEEETQGRSEGASGQH